MQNPKSLRRLRTGLSITGACLVFLLVGNAADAIEIGKKTQEVRGGTEVVGHNGIVEIDGCTGSILNERVIVTAAHCLSAQSGASVMTVNYFRPTIGKEQLWNGILRWEQHPEWKGKFSVVDVYDNDYAIHDIAYLYNPAQPWPNTSYLDYLRVYQDKGNRIDSVRLWGLGYETYSGNGSGVLRSHVFPLNHNPTYNVIETEGTDDYNMCKGDSGGPVIKEVETMELITGVNSSVEHQWVGSENCSRQRGDQWHARTNGDHLNWIETRTNIVCTLHRANGYRYKRCFDIPFINDIAYEGLDKNVAVAIVAAIF